MRTLLISTYDLGRQPFGLASAAAFLRRGGHAVTCVDLSRDPMPDGAVEDAALVAFYLPMHTATRLALPVIDRVRAINPGAALCAYGLYAPLNAGLLRARGVQTILGPEFEEDLAALASAPDAPRGVDPLPRVHFMTPDRAGLPPLARYASLRTGDTRRAVGYTEATRGCKHRCRHCPIVPVYDGRFRAVPIDVVLADIRAQVAAGAEHITFGDPDFFNGPTHALAIVEAVAREWPGLTYDVTIKVEHLARHTRDLPRLRATGCAFVTSAVESFDDTVLERLEKGHTHADTVAVVRHCREIGLPLSPTFVAFTPWTTMGGYRGWLDALADLDLVHAVAPIQYAIRLLVPQGSRMLELEDMRARVRRFDAGSLTHIWEHADPAVDRLQQRIERLVGRQAGAAREDVFRTVRQLAYAADGLAAPDVALVARAAIPYLDEPWYC